MYSEETVPLVSVVIATYNQEKYVGRAIESVYAQTWPQIELIVVNDGSTSPYVPARIMTCICGSHGIFRRSRTIASLRPIFFTPEVCSMIERS